MLFKKKNFISNNTGILIRFDDITENMNWQLMDKCEKLLDKYKIKPMLGVIPLNKDKEFLAYKKRSNFWSQVRKWQKKGWEISMHGCHHLYKSETNKNDFFGYGGRSEFFGLNFSAQKKQLFKGLEKFKKEKIKIRSFYAPNHTYDDNTFKALKKVGIKNIIDGYGLFPYTEKELNFFPQLFYKEIFLPFGIQCTQTHLNYWKEKDFEKFKKFIIKNRKKIISFEESIKKINNSYFCKILKFLSKKILQILRSF